MKFSKLDLLTLLISLFLFASCNKSSTIGLDLDPEDAINGDLLTLPVNSKTVADDAAVTYFGATQSNPARVPFGTLSDPIFGTTDVSVSMAVSPPSRAFSFGTAADLDSAVLVLPFTPGFYGDTITTVYKFDVKRLANSIADETSFLSNKTWATEDAIAGSFTGKIKPATPFKITSVVNGAADTLKTVPASIRIKLSNQFIEDNIMSIGAAQLANNVTFQKAFKGLQVSASKNGSIGGIMFLNFSTANLEIYYRNQNTTTATKRDTLLTTFPINQTNGPVAASIKHVYTTAVTAQLEDNTDKQYDVTYVQPLAGLRNKISFPTLKDLAKQIGGKVVINKAELVVETNAGTDVSPFAVAQRLALYQYDIAGQRSLVQDQNSSDPRFTGNFGGVYSSGQKIYRFILTAYVQDLVDGKTKDFGTYLAPAPTQYNLAAKLSTADIASPIVFAERAVLNGGEKMKLNIYYTKY